MLPDGSGIDFCRELHDSSRVPVIMVTARTSEVDVVLGLEIGAADYVTKPYRLRELVARMRAVLRRPAAPTENEVVTFGDLRVDVVRRSVTRRGREVELSRKEFDLLALFASRLGQVVTREVCLDTLWWGLELSDTRTLDTHVKRLRQKIEDDPAHPRAPAHHPRRGLSPRPLAWGVQSGDLAPEFALPDQDGVTRSLGELPGRRPRRPLLLPRGQHGGLHARGVPLPGPLRRLRRASGATRVGVSMDDVESQRAFAGLNRFDYPLLSDPDGAVARLYGVKRRI